jgi:predicted enzyme related to lactoylglutathione lyase
MGNVRDLPARTYPHGVPSWVDTEQPDVEAAIAFYGGLFGWTFDDVMPAGAPSRYVIAKLDGRDVAAIGGPLEGAVPAWNTYISVDDADAVRERLRLAVRRPRLHCADPATWLR